MKYPEKPSFDPDEQFARDLERAHARIVENSEDGESPTSASPRVQSAIPVLKMLEQELVKKTKLAGETAKLEQFPTINELAGTRSLVNAPSSYLHLERLGRFHLREQLGQGGFGVVMRARDSELNRDVALKIPRFETTLSGDSCARFEREARAAASLNHPGIVSVYETGLDGGVFFIVCELVQGDDLGSWIANGNRMDSQEAAQLLVCLADAVEHAHQRGVLHRDLKPANILLEQNDLLQPRVTDFGLASLVEDQSLTSPGDMVGTPANMAPEQAAGDGSRVGPATDVYGLGTVLYEVLTGRKLFDGLPLVSVLKSIAAIDPPSITEFRSDVSRDLEAICFRCLAKEPSQRYESARDLQSDLQRFLSGEAVVARPLTKLGRGMRWMGRNRLVSSLGTSLVLGLTVGLIVLSFLWRSSEMHREFAEKNGELYLQKVTELEGVIDRMFSWVKEIPELGLPGMEPVRERMLNDVNSYYDRLLADKPADPDLRAKRTETLIKIADLKSVLSDVQGSIEIANKILTDLPRLEDSTAKQRQQRIDAEMLMAQQSFRLGQSEEWTGYLDSALKNARDIYRRGKTRSTADHIEMAQTLIEAADIVASMGQRTQSNELALEAVGIWEQVDPNLLDDVSVQAAYGKTLVIAAKALAASEQKDRGKEIANRAIRWMDFLVQNQQVRDPKVFWLKNEAWRIGAFLNIDNEFEAVRHAAEAIRGAELLKTNHPLVSRYHRQWISSKYGLGLAHFIQKNYDVALPVFQDLVVEGERLLERFPNDPGIKPLHVNNLTMAGIVAGESGRPAAQLAIHRKARTLALDEVERTSGQVSARLRLAGIDTTIGKSLILLKRFEEALESLNSGCATLKQIVKQDLQNGEALRFLNTALADVAQAESALGHWPEALKAMEQSIEYQRSSADSQFGDLAVYLAGNAQYEKAMRRLRDFQEFLNQTREEGSLKAAAAASRVIEAAISSQISGDSISPKAEAFVAEVTDVGIQALMSWERPETESRSWDQVVGGPSFEALRNQPKFKKWLASEATR